MVLVGTVALYAYKVMSVKIALLRSGTAFWSKWKRGSIYRIYYIKINR